MALRPGRLPHDAGPPAAQHPHPGERVGREAAELGDPVAVEELVDDRQELAHDVGTQEDDRA